MLAYLITSQTETKNLRQAKGVFYDRKWWSNM